MCHFKRIPGHNGWYSVSSDGRVFSDARASMREMKAGPGSVGYKKVGLYCGKKQATHAVHRLVAEAFVPNPDNLPEVNHINGNKLDNRAENLEWTDRSGNALHSFDTGLHPWGEGRYNSKLTQEAVKDIRDNYVPRAVPYRHFAEKYGVSIDAVRYAFVGKNWSRVS